MAAPTLPDGNFDLKLGESLKKDSGKKTAYHTVRYDFKPASVGSSKESYIQFDDKSGVNIMIPKIDESTSDVVDATVYRGSKEPATQKELLLIWNPDTNEMWLERLTNKIRVKKLREKVSSSQVDAIRQCRKSRRSSAASKTGSATVETSGSEPKSEQQKDDEVMSDDENGSESGEESEDDEEDGSDDDNQSSSEDDDDEDGIAKSLEAELSKSGRSGEQAVPKTTSAPVASAAGATATFPKKVVKPNPVSAKPPSRSALLNEDLRLSESSDDD